MITSCYNWAIESGCGNRKYRLNRPYGGMLLSDVRGIGLPNVSVETEIARNRDGVVYRDSRTESRVLEFDFTVCGCNCDEFEAMRNEFVENVINCNPECGSLDDCAFNCDACEDKTGFGTCRLSYSYCASKCLPERRCIDVVYNGVVGEPTLLTDKTGSCWVQTISFLMPYPYASNCCPEYVCVSPEDAEDGRICVDLPYNGNVLSYPKIDVYGAIENVSFTMNDGSAVATNYTSNQNEVVTFNLWHGEKTVTNNYGQVLSITGIDSCWSDLLLKPKCENQICIDYDSIGEGTRICVSYWQWYQLI